MYSEKNFFHLEFFSNTFFNWKDIWSQIFPCLLNFLLLEIQLKPFHSRIRITGWAEASIAHTTFPGIPRKWENRESKLVISLWVVNGWQWCRAAASAGSLNNIFTSRGRSSAWMITYYENKINDYREQLFFFSNEIEKLLLNPIEGYFTRA